MIKSIILPIPFIVVISAFSQQTLMSSPRHKSNYDKVGYYDIAVIEAKSELNRGEKLEVDVMLTGYGKIGLSKVYMTPSADNIFEPTSQVFTSLKREGDSLFWGNDVITSGTQNWIINFSGGFDFKNEDSSTYSDSYIDRYNTPSDISIITEYKSHNAPISFKLNIRNDARPGNYSIKFYYTYFNGLQWYGTYQSVNFKINNFLEEHYTAFQVLGLLIAAVGAIPAFESIYKYYKSIFNKRKKTSTRIIRK